MIAWFFVASWLLVYPAIGAGFGEIRRCPNEIDPQPTILFKIVVKVAPPGILFHVIVKLAKYIDKSPTFYVHQGIAFFFCEMKFVFPSHRLPYVHFVRSNVKVAAQNDIILGRKTVV